MRTWLLALALLAACLPAGTLPAAAAEADAAKTLDQIGVARGICVVLGDQQCKLALDLARRSQLTLYVQLPDPADVEPARRAAEAAGLLGTRVYVEAGKPDRIALADNVADAAVVLGEAAAASKTELLRVLRPEGKAIVGDQAWTKPIPEGTDDWTHHYHGPNNNPQTRDKLAKAPYLTQYMADPRYAPAPQAAVSSAGRVFMAFGHVAWHEREEPWLNTLVALNAYNGTLLWKRPITSGIMVDRNTLVATPDTLYLADEKSCKLIDAATGEVRSELAPPKSLTGDTFWKWMALENDTLYALVGEDEPADPVAKWRSTRHGWPWTGISKGYNENEYQWGFAKTLVALDPKSSGKVLWSHQEDPPIDSRATCLNNGRMYIHHFGQYLACLDAKTGKELWRRTAQKDPGVFQAIGPYRPGHGYIGGWKSTVYLKATEKALYFIGPQVEWLTAVSAEDGRFLWKHPAKDLHVVVRDDAVYVTGPQNSTDNTKKLDALTGKVLASYTTARRACTRSTGACDSIFFRAHEGTGRFDVATGTMQWISTMRPSCHVGVLVANGHLYWVPWACDCSLQMFGAICLGPAGDFAFDQKATTEDRLEKPAGLASAGKLAVASDDWPTYRADNARSARTQAAVPEKVRLLWRYEPKAAVEPTAPVAAGGMVFFSGADGVVRALDAATGKPQWTAFAGGAVHFPPAVADGRALVGADDGWAYAFSAASGAPLWRFRAAPVERRIPVFGLLRSNWPVAGGVLVDKGTAYFAAGLTDYDGTHVYAVDAASGEIRWQNNTCGHLDATSRRGVACQGEMLLSGNTLYMAGGNSVGAASFDAATGACLNQAPTGMGGKAPRGRELALANNGVKVSGQPFYSHHDYPVFDKSTDWQEAVVSAKNARLACEERKTNTGPAWTLVARNPTGGAELWAEPLPGEPVRWAVAVDAQGRIVVSLRSGQVLCFGK